MCLVFGICYGFDIYLPNYLIERMHLFLLESISGPITILYLLPITVDVAALGLSVKFPPREQGKGTGGH